MALSTLQVIQVCEILGADRIQMTAHLNYFDIWITSEVVANVAAKISSWFDDGIGAKTTEIIDKESNEGVRTNPETARQLIRESLESSLCLTSVEWYGGGSGSNQIVLERG